ncbi:hypothetical protein OSB04_002644 [Centaurea solstitialis]|uniref:Uncharacterized protein n=1 Tax=Centaurea solstitialis TaxID=347529 RepID=A0AA38UBL0_9ASTR|nr:hypothetical protein OSB04_002644 [Centaurea solstitialis]
MTPRVRFKSRQIQFNIFGRNTSTSDITSSRIKSEKVILNCILWKVTFRLLIYSLSQTPFLSSKQVRNARPTARGLGGAGILYNKPRSSLSLSLCVDFNHEPEEVRVFVREFGVVDRLEDPFVRFITGGSSSSNSGKIHLYQIQSFLSPPKNHEPQQRSIAGHRNRDQTTSSVVVTAIDGGGIEKPP